MRFLIISLAMLLAGFGVGFSQDLTIKYGDLDVTNDSVYLQGPKSTELMEVRLSVTNNRSTSVSLKLRKTEIRVVEGAETSFCWGECYTPFVTVSPMIITILPGGTDRNSFIGEYRPFEMEGTSVVKYTFFNPADTTYQQSVTVFYQIGGSGINLSKPFSQVVRVYPNPASGFVRITLEGIITGSCVATLTDMQGRVVLAGEIPASKREITWPVAELPDGNYLIRIANQQGAQSVHKILVSHH